MRIARVVAVSLWGMAGMALAQAEITNRLVMVPAPQASCMVVSESAGLLIVGQRGIPDHHLLIHHLNPDGTLAASPPVALTFPVPDPVKALKAHPLAMALHPRLPLLYLWRDVEGTKPDSAEEKAVFGSFEHALIYAITNKTLLQVAAFARGTNFLCEQTYGWLTVDDTGKRLFVPNLRDPATKQVGIAYYDLDEKGQPVPIPVPVPGTLDGYGVNKYETQVLPTWINVQHLRPHTTGLGLSAPNPDTALFSASQGVGVWNPSNRRGPLGYFAFTGETDYWILADPALPVVFGATVNANKLFRMAHADGYPTLLPQLIWVSGALFQSRPALLPGKKPFLIVGGNAQVHFVPLVLDGTFSPDPPLAVATTPGPVRAVAVSAKLNRIYAAVEKAP